MVIQVEYRVKNENIRTMKKVNLIFVGLISLLITSCSNKVDFGEQYKKVIYIVNSKEQLYYAGHQPVVASVGSISIYCGGTELSDKDISVTCIVDEEALAVYNKREFGNKTERYFLTVPENRISYKNMVVTIPKGHEFGCLDFTINTLGLEPDRIYVIPISISDASGYEVEPNQKTIFYALRILNEYAGDYASVYEINGAKTSVMKIAVATAASQIMIPLGPNTNTADLSTSFFRIQLEADNSIVLSPYLLSEVELLQKKGKKYNYYDPATKTFYLYYKMYDRWGDPVIVDEILKKM